MRPCVVSVASIWELAIKHRLGKLPVAPAALRDQSPLVQHDPFDRLLIAQAQVEGLMALSSEAHWPGYDVSLHRPGHPSTVLGTKHQIPAIVVPSISRTRSPQLVSRAPGAEASALQWLLALPPSTSPRSKAEIDAELAVERDW